MFRTGDRPTAIRHGLAFDGSLWAPPSAGALFARVRKLPKGRTGGGSVPVRLAAEAARRGAPVLVFCTSKAACESEAKALALVLAGGGASTTARAVLAAALRQSSMAAAAAADLAGYARCGVAYHHAGLPKDSQKLIEEAYKHGTLLALASTSTLAAGVNLPAARVVVAGVAAYGGRILFADYLQMSGRAGRTGLCKAGTVSWRGACVIVRHCRATLSLSP